MYTIFMMNGTAVTDTEKLLALQALLTDVIHDLNMTQHDIEDGEKAHQVEKLADVRYQQMLDIVHA